MSGTLRRLGAAATALTLAALAGGCGVSTDDEPQMIGRENVPAELLDDRTPSDDSVPTEPGTGEVVTVWFLVHDGESTWLQAVDRTVPWPAGTDRPFGALFAEPTDAEREEGIYTSIPKDSHLTQVPTRDGLVLELNMAENFYEGGVEAFAQVVYTATELDNVEAVRFMEDGEPRSVVNGEGQAVEGPVGRLDYARLERPGG